MVAISSSGRVVERPALEVALTGRPYIGPKVQTKLEEDLHRYVRAEASSRGVTVSEVWREILLDAVPRRYGLDKR